MSGSEKKLNRTAYNISLIKRVSRKFLEVSRCRRAKQRQRNVQKKCLARAKFFFLVNQTYCFFFFFCCFRCRRRLVSITRFFYFVSVNYRYQQELRFQPWLNLYIIMVITKGQGVRATTIERDQITSDRWSKRASDQIAFHAFYSFQWKSKRSWLCTCRSYEIATCRFGLRAPLVTRNFYYDFFLYISFSFRTIYDSFDCFDVVYQIN